MFRKFQGVKKDSEPVPFVEKRIEYFIHYWSLIFTDRVNNILMDEHKLESHRVIIKRIEAQFGNDPRPARRRIDVLLAHPYFSGRNIISKHDTVQAKIQKIRGYISTVREYEANKSKVVKGVATLKKYLFEKLPYHSRLKSESLSLLCKNKPLNNDVKSNIKFIVSAFIVELYHAGYELEFIKKVPSKTFFPESVESFPFEKRLKDFGGDEKLYKDYQNQQNRNWTVAKHLNGIVNLINYKKNEGFIVFKINHLKLPSSESIKIGEVEFYNPQKAPKLITEENEKLNFPFSMVELETFSRVRNNKEVISSLPSNCNALVSSFFRQKNFRKEEVFIAFMKVQKALYQLNFILKQYSIDKGIYGSLDINSHFLLHSNLRPSNVNAKAFFDGSVTLNFSQKYREDFAKEELSFLKRLDLSNIVEEKFYNIITTQRKLQVQEVDFNFSELWKAWESLLPGNQIKDKVEAFKKVILDSFKIRWRNDFVIEILGELNVRLARNVFFNSVGYYSLTDVELKDAGLQLSEGKYSIRKFKNNYMKVYSFVDCEIVHDILFQLDTFENNSANFYQKVKGWVDYTIDEVYSQRNFETHQNDVCELSEMKLKNDFIYMSGYAVNTLVHNSNSRNRKNISKIIERLANSVRKVGL